MWSEETSKAIRAIADEIWAAMGRTGTPAEWVQYMAYAEHMGRESRLAA